MVEIHRRLPFNPATITTRQIGQRWKIADGNNWLLDFGPAEGIFFANNTSNNTNIDTFVAGTGGVTVAGPDIITQGLTWNTGTSTYVPAFGGVCARSSACPPSLRRASAS